MKRYILSSRTQQAYFKKIFIGILTIIKNKMSNAYLLTNSFANITTLVT